MNSDVGVEVARQQTCPWEPPGSMFFLGNGIQSPRSKQWGLWAWIKSPILRGSLTVKYPGGGKQNTGKTWFQKSDGEESHDVFKIKIKITINMFLHRVVSTF